MTNSTRYPEVLADAPVVLSLGAGVQSSTLLLMAIAEEFESTPELAIFADTGWEPEAVYRHLDWLEAEVGDRIEIVRVKAGNIRDDLVAHASGGRRFASPPLFTRGPVPAACRVCGGSGLAGGIDAMLLAVASGDSLSQQQACARCAGGGLDPEDLTGDNDGFLRRQCTREYKIEPIARELRRRGFGPKRPVRQWIGISRDELQRQKPSRIGWMQSSWPLIERNLSRSDCLRWFTSRYPDRPLVKSACIGCPFHSDATWRRMREQSPREFSDAAEVDAAIRTLPKLVGEAFLHRSRVPLAEVDLSSREDAGQLALLDEEGFAEECEGMCGT